jgi:hypothetical protein
MSSYRTALFIRIFKMSVGPFAEDGELGPDLPEVLLLQGLLEGQLLQAVALEPQALLVHPSALGGWLQPQHQLLHGQLPVAALQLRLGRLPPPRVRLHLLQVVHVTRLGLLLLVFLLALRLLFQFAHGSQVLVAQLVGVVRWSQDPLRLPFLLLYRF